MYNLESFLIARFDAYSKAFLAGWEPSTLTRIFENIFHLYYNRVCNIVFDCQNWHNEEGGRKNKNYKYAYYVMSLSIAVVYMLE